MAKSTSTTPASACGVRAAWDQAVAHLRLVEEEFAHMSAQHTAAFEAAQAACPREAEFFSRYGLGCWENEDKGRALNLGAARAAVIRERCRDLGRMLTAEEDQHATAAAEHVVTSFDEWRKRYEEAHKRHHCDLWQERFDAVVDKRWSAQQAVIDAEAPDLQALLVKLEILIGMMDGQEDLGRVIAIREDARRLVAA